MKIENASWNILDVWANTPILHAYDSPESCDIAELQSGDAPVIIEDQAHLLAFNGYYRVGRQGTAPHMLTRDAVFKRLQTLSALIAPELSVSVFDAFRTLATQTELFKEFFDVISVDNPEWTEEEVHARTLLFVADPNDQPAHNTGGAIDLSLFDKASGVPLDFGAEIDELSDWSRTDYFETHTASDLNLPDHQWRHIRRNRRILFNGMKSLGFVNLPSEWWHYDIGNANWASVHQCKPIYASMETTHLMLTLSAHLE